ncbi:MAG: YraN family protein [Bacteroidales bacterium]|nr:YraN family protein [Bacteroidales bacterium]
MKSESYKLGQDGEEAAVAHLRKQGYDILEQRWHLHHLELDIVALDRSSGEIVFVEVKTRSSGQYGSPEEAVDYKKVMATVRAADAYIKQYYRPEPWRFDIISVMGSAPNFKIDHIKEAFYTPLG